MKKLIFVFVLCFIPSIAVAAPFLVCDPVPIDGMEPTEYIVLMDTSNGVISQAFVSGSTVSLKFDLANIAPGSHTVSVVARRTDPAWPGVLESAPSAPFTFVKPASPKVPVNIKLSK